MATKTTKANPVKSGTTKKNIVKGNLDKILVTAKSVNQQVVDTTIEVMSDVIDQSSKIREELVEKVSAGVKFDGKNIKKAANNANKFALETTEEFSTAVFNTAEKWQGLTEKTVKDGLKLAQKQQVFVFDTLEVIKGQFVEGIDRFSKLFSRN